MLLLLFPCPPVDGVEEIWGSVPGLVGLILLDVDALEGSVAQAKDCSVVTVRVWLVGLNCSAVGAPLRSLLRLVVFTSRPASGFPSDVIGLLLVVFPCVSDVQ